MAEYGDEERQEYSEGEDSLEDPTAANVTANNSIIGKVRSSVTSILPNSLSKWFSPSSNNNNDSANGSYVSIKRTRADSEANTPNLRIDRRSEMARRRIEVNDYNEEEDEDGDGDGDAEDDGDDVEDDVAAEESDETDQQPPLKRSRVTLDNTLLSARPLIASTPSLNAQRNSGTLNHHYGHLNLFPGTNRKEIGYNAYTSAGSGSNFGQQNVAPDIIDLIPVPMTSRNHDVLNTRNTNQQLHNEVPRSRRTLNIPPSNVTPTGSVYSSCVLPSLKRQSLSSVKSSNTTPDTRQKIVTQSYAHKNDSLLLDPALELENTLLEQETYNGSVQSKFQNGASDFEDELRPRSVTDSEAEDGDTVTEMPTNVSIHSTLKSGMASQRAASSGLFNMSTGNSRSGSRTSSFGNGLNFYTHLEGRKSLFASNNPTTRTNMGNPLNSSTLSLNSLSRRQFNASIYGSTSALSDSRLLNTSSPFYKGNTTYGGAAAYSKYTTTLGSNSRLTPTLIRPTSSLSTLSSSNNSIAAGAGLSNAHGEQNPAISGTAKTILDLLNGFSTPLSEAKKMASSILQQQTSSSLQNSKSKRLSDADINTSRTMRLQQVRTPYMRPSVMLQPKKTSESQMPPIRELQVPSMSQLLQMKKMQMSTERSRQITMQKSDDTEATVSTVPSTSKTVDTLDKPTEPSLYTLPTTTNPIEQPTERSGPSSGTLGEHKQQKHVNKIKHKIANTLRAPEIPDESPPIPANLPNIAFPLMKEMPKIDIVLPIVAKKTTAKFDEKEIAKAKVVSTAVNDFQCLEKSFKFSPPIVLKDIPSSVSGVESSMCNFEFSKPAPLEEVTSSTTVSKPKFDVAKVSLPDGHTSLQSALFALPKPTVPNAVPALKTGSVLDALKKPFVLPKVDTVETTNPLTNLQSLNSFGGQFKKGSNEWECDTCMVRNKESAQKCVACDVPRKGAPAPTTSLQKSQTPSVASAPIAFGFSNQFKKQAGEWECDTCLIRNKPESNSCISCETPRKPEAKSSSQNDNPKPFGQSIIGNSLKSLPSNIHTTTADSGFKLLATTQQASKWECEACMTRNDSSRSKCVCCEQPKPGSESQKENAPSFNFGATAASKFTFGFSPSAPDPAKDSELRQKASDSSVNTTTVAQKPSLMPQKGFTFGQPAPVSSTQTNSLSFGFQPKSTNEQDKATNVLEKDTADSSAKKGGFSFGFATSASPKTSTTLTFSAATTKVELPTKSTATNQTSPTQSATNTIATTTTVVTTTSFTPPKVPTFGFFNAPSTTITSTTTSVPTTSNEGFGSSLSFQKTVSSNSTTTANNVSSSSSNKLSFPFATSQTSLLTTIASATTTSNVSATTTTASPSLNFGVVSTSATSTTTSVKPMFSFKASPIPNTSTGNVSSSTLPSGATTTTTTSLGGSIGLNFANTTPSLVPNTVSSTQSPFSITPNVNSTSSPNLNTFGGFGSPKTNTQTVVPILTTTSAPTFGSFSFGNTTATNAKIESGNLFGTPTQKPQEETKATASVVPIFGNSTAQTEQKISTSNTWPKNSFLFGSPANTATSNSGAFGPDSTPKAIFGNLKGESTESTINPLTNKTSSASSIFGNSNASSAAHTFGNNVSAPTVLFGTGSAPAPTTTNLFGTNNNNNTTLPQFGTIMAPQTNPGSNSVANPTPSFGNPSSVGFGSFGASANTTTPSSTTMSEPSTQTAVTPFAFGAPQTQTATSGFNFGATAGSARPAFNFTSSSQPTFNFSGSSTETTQNSTRPFQFGATAAPNFNAPSVFNFGGAPSTETTSNTPFQFNAGSSPATSNIFAPAPTASTATQAARRKVRIPNRRLTPR